MSWPRLVLAALVLLLYLRSPIDLVPDRIGALGLLDDLIVLLIAVWWVRSRWRAAATVRAAAREPAAAPGEAPWNPYAVLGIARDASADEISRAYREQMKRYHPDRVANLGTELQQLAHQKTVEIQRAYEEIGLRDRGAGAAEPQ